MPKQRDPHNPYPKRTDHIPDSVRALAIVGRTHMRVIEDAEDLIDGMPSVKLFINPPPKLINFTGFTEEELDIYKTMFLDAIERARPHCVELDRRAAVAIEENDMRYRRQWRTRPVYQNFDKQQGTRRDAEQQDP